MFTQLANIWTAGLVVGEAISDERLSFLGYGGIGRKVNFRRMQHRLVTEDMVLGLAITKWTSSKQHLEVNNPD